MESWLPNYKPFFSSWFKMGKQIQISVKGWILLPWYVRNSTFTIQSDKNCDVWKLNSATQSRKTPRCTCKQFKIGLAVVVRSEGIWRSLVMTFGLILLLAGLWSRRRRGGGGLLGFHRFLFWLASFFTCFARDPLSLLSSLLRFLRTVWARRKWWSEVNHGQ